MPHCTNCNLPIDMLRDAEYLTLEHVVNASAKTVALLCSTCLSQTGLGKLVFRRIEDEVRYEGFLPVEGVMRPRRDNS